MDFDSCRFYCAQQYIQAALNLLEGMVQSGNPLFLISDTMPSDKELQNHIKNSSCSIILPAMFCFYQGVELLIKGFIRIKQGKAHGHNAEELLSLFIKYYPDSQDLTDLFQKHIISFIPFIKDYREENDIVDLETLYNSFRYPDRKDNNTNNYYKLKNPKNEVFIPQIVEMISDIQKILCGSVKLYWALKDS